MKKNLLIHNTRFRLFRERYQKLSKRLQRAIQSGSFYDYSKKKQEQLLKRLERYARRLHRLPAQLPKGSMSSIIIAGALSGLPVNQVAAQAFAPSITDPFGLTRVGRYADPSFVDIDGDGDLDAFIGETGGNIQFSENTGNAIVPEFATAGNNPFGLTNVGYNSSPNFVDIDGDGDLDAFVGGASGNIQFFENTGSAAAPAFASSITNPFGLTDVGYYVNPSFADLDGDGDLDAFIGGDSGNIEFFENTGSTIAPAFNTVSTNPFGLTNVGNYSKLSFADLDDDGDLDAFIGEDEGYVHFFENTGTALAPAFTTVSTNPFGLTDVGYTSSISFADLDGDGDLDAFIGEFSGNINFFENTAPAPDVNTFKGLIENPYGLTNVSAYAVPNFVDIDGDGDLDAFVGEDSGNIQFFENTGSAIAPAFHTASTNPFGLTDVGKNSSPSFVDIDGDGDLDVFVGELHTTINFFENTGTATAPAFSTVINNPFGLAIVSIYSQLSFADLDGDGDLDAFIGESYGNIQFFENTGSAIAPAFHTIITNPFGLTDIGHYSDPSFADLDGDGDLDAFVGEVSGKVKFFENTGSVTSPAFTTVSTNPFGLTDIGSLASISFADVDRDGDLDVFIGGGDGNINFFKSGGPEISLEANSNAINDGATSDEATTTNGTDFGNLCITDGENNITYTITNSGTDDLILSGTPIIALSGHTDDFSVTAQATSPVSNLAGTNTTTFTIKFDPAIAGERSAIVSIMNDDSDKITFDFAIKGTGDAATTVAAAGADISQCDDTDFTISANTPTMGSGKWSFLGGTGSIPIITTPTNPTSSVTGLAPGNLAILRWTIINGICSSHDDLLLRNNTYEDIAAAGNDKSQCNTADFIMAANTPNSGTGLWSIVSSTGAAPSITTPTSPTSGVTGLPAGTSAILSWTLSNELCSSSDEVTIINEDATCENDCTDNLEILNGVSSAISSDTYQAALTITSDDIVPNGNTVVFKAGESITLLENFHAQAGSNFTAKIEDCVNADNLNQPANSIAQSRISIPLENSLSQINFKVFPNPMLHDGQIHFQLPEVQEVSIGIYDQSGRLVQEILPLQKKNAGDYYLAFNREGLYNGLFFVVLQSAKERLVQKLVINGH